MISENIYWIAISDLKMKTEKINKLLIYIYQNLNNNIRKFFETIGKNGFHYDSLDDTDIEEILSLKHKWDKYKKIENELEDMDIEIVPVNSDFYSKRLKENLKTKRKPAVLYTKGDKKLLNEESVAIVGSRNASDISLKFTDYVVKRNVEISKIIVSGYAKGVDRQALDSALKYSGKSIIVLPQGILTFTSGLKKYENEIKSGKVLVVSTYFPKAPWSVQLAMARNSIIYGLAKEIFVAESNFSGGTWSGVQEGLRRNQKIFVRKPIQNEDNANNKLIELGAIPYSLYFDKDLEIQKETLTQVSDKVQNKETGIENLIMNLISTIPKTSKKIKEELNLNWSTNRITSLLKNKNYIEVIKSKPLKFVRKNSEQISIFN